MKGDYKKMKKAFPNLQLSDECIERIERSRPMKLKWPEGKDLDEWFEGLRNLESDILKMMSEEIIKHDNQTSDNN